MSFTRWFEMAYVMRIERYYRLWCEKYGEDTWERRAEELTRQYELYKQEHAKKN
ncbi:hypothetical protein [Halobacillus karajensis]|uniref:hypothetical protein n=1 Tax=Halobacillus karajensis TaxID=195088 RepID=UPI00045CADE0|nr:hypothetical protein [Halobacillus karajensis]CDQ21682.1 hypothetical protein BN982_04091 [Halobacillus karajensis]